MRKLMFANLKGGVGKTVSAVSVAHGLALRGQKTLLIDADPQGNSSNWLLTKEDNVVLELADIIAEKAEFSRAIINIKENLDIVPTFPDGDLRIVSETELIKKPFLFEDYFKEVSDIYDFLLLDTSPSFSPLERSLCIAVDEVVLPLELEFFAVDGFLQFDKNIQALNRNWRKNVIIKNILLTKENKSFSRHKLLRKKVQEAKGYNFYTIRQDALIAESIGLNKTIFERDEDSKSAKDYMAVVEDIINGKF